MQTQTPNTERVDFRTTPDVKALIERAAAIHLHALWRAQ